jgi:2-oxoisovalerate dehydrogenase E1 component
MADKHEYVRIELDPAVPDDALDRYPGELRQAMLIRRTEERLLELFSQGKLFGTVHTCIGQEFVAVAVARALRPEDTIFSNHRGHGHFLAYCENVVGLIGEVMGKSIGVCGGRGGSQHLQQDNYFSNGVQGGIVPVATGLGLAHRLRRTGGVSVVFVGDGTLGQGALYESMNIASLWDLPVLFVCENNLVAQSTSQTQTLAGDICARAAAFGIETAHGNTWDWPRLFDQMRLSVDRVRETSRPLFHRVDTFRLKAHSKGDDNRPSSYVAEHERRDPIHALNARYGSDPRWVRMVAEIQERIDDATSRADAADFDTLEPGAGWKGPREHFWTARPFERERIVQSVRRGLQNGLAAHSGMILIGEDVESPYGGAFKCTAGLSDEFPGRVRNTPISELALAGLGNGLALGGLKPVVEIMFGDFMTLTADQWINHASKFRFMFNDKVRVPVVLRTPMGGKRGYAATHSQTIEKHFLGLPDTQVLCLHHRDSPERLYRALFESIDRPTLVIENKTLYGQYCSSDPPPGYDLVFSDGEAFPMARLKPKGPPDLTIVAIGGMSIEAEQALALLFKEDEIAVDLFLPTRLYPFDADVFESSLRTSRRLLVVEEGLAFASLSSEILAQVVERYGQRGLVCRRVNAAVLPIPAARPLEQECLPDTAAIVRMAREIMRELVH